VSHRDLPRTLAELLVPGTDNPFPGHSLARHWNSDRPARPDPVLSQLEEPRLKGDDFRTHQVNKVDSVIDEDHILIEYSNKSAELFDLFRDREQTKNLAEQASETSRQERLRRKLDSMLFKTTLP